MTQSEIAAARLDAVVEGHPWQEPDEAFLRSYCEPVMVAIDRLCEWIGGCRG